ncbi:baseplate multidomain protein megatron [Devosia salina]|uniref:Glycoside hydrolase/phage tail family protein n=1 Tax=Devosia salina TaxID=2860336 RepID=A0ABX8WI78_9HYPH|nr:glycoside hydrolase/phage tail family protein [Devosia salina]QYO77955.1 glycoside hydrolase/phage tail family protein [Devosia salina]
MATLALSVAGQFVGGLVGGPIGATVGRALGALAGSAVDGFLFGGDKAEGPLFDVRLGSSSEGLGVPRLYGWGRLSGNIIWARELVRHQSETAGSKGFGPTEDTEEVLASFAIGFCEGRVARLGRIWADGQLLDTRDLNLRFYHGDDDQMPDSLIEAVQGVGNAPAYRGLCYLVVENLPLSRFGNRIPQLSAELCRVVGDLEPAIRAVTVIPGATEFGYDPVPRVRVLGPGAGVSENAHLAAGVSDWTCSIDELQALCPNLEHVALVVSWFGDDLRCGTCTVSPRVEGATRQVEGATWSVAGVSREVAQVVSSHEGGPAYGGTPSDASVLAAIADLKARGLKVTLYPFVLMDIPQDNALPDPHGGTAQAAYPWRGRLTCNPAPGQAGSPDGTADAASQVAAFVPGYRAMMLHYSDLAVAAGGVDAMLIGSEMVGLSTVCGAGNSFPFVAALVDLAADMRAIVGPGTKLTYAADWSEYSGCQNGTEKFFHLDPLWASDDVDAVGIDCYLPLADWRDGEAHADAALATTGYELGYLAGNIAGGEGFDWYYASDADRRAQARTPITDEAHGEHWVWRVKDIAAFWGQYHHDRPGGVRSPTPTAWVPGSKPIWLTELGCGAVDKGANQPNIFGDEKSAESGRPYFSSGTPDGLIQRQVLRAHHNHWTDPANNPAGMVDPDRLYCWTWDARPFPAFPAQTDVWADGSNHRTGHWLTGRLGALASDELAMAIAAEHDCDLQAVPTAPLIGGLTMSAPATAREAIEPVLEMTGQRLAARGGVLVGLAQGPVTAALIEQDDLAQTDAPTLSRRRGDPAEKPGRLALGHFDRERDYLAATATALRRHGAAGVRELAAGAGRRSGAPGGRAPSQPPLVQW